MFRPQLVSPTSKDQDHKDERPKMCNIDKIVCAKLCPTRNCPVFSDYSIKSYPIRMKGQQYNVKNRIWPGAASWPHVRVEFHDNENF